MAPPWRAPMMPTCAPSSACHAPPVTYGIDHADAHILPLTSSSAPWRPLHRTEVRMASRRSAESSYRCQAANLQNALAAVAVGEQVGLDFERTRLRSRAYWPAPLRALRRSQRRAHRDDYGHHLTEIAAVMAAARATPSAARGVPAASPLANGALAGCARSRARRR